MMFLPCTGGHSRILLIDDDSDDLIIVSTIFKEISDSATIAYKQYCEEAIEYFAERNHDAVDLILLDLNMPRMSGEDCLKILKGGEHTKDIPVIVYSTSTRDKDRRTALALGAAEFITKSNTLGELTKQFRRVYNTYCVKQHAGRH